MSDDQVTLVAELDRLAAQHARLAARPVSCAPISLDPYGRTVATGTVGGADLGDWLVRGGLALDWPHYSHGRYGVPWPMLSAPGARYVRVACSGGLGLSRVRAG